MSRITIILLITALFILSIVIPLHSQSLESVSKFLYHERYRAVAKYDNYLYCPGYTSLQILSIEDIYNISLEKELDYSNNGNIQIINNWAFITGSQFRVFDLIDPLNPELIFEYDWQYSAGTIKMLDNYAYIYTGEWEGMSYQNKIRIFDLSNPLNPNYVYVLESSYPGNIAGYDIDNNRLCICWYDLYGPCGAEINIYDVSDPSSPFEINSIDLPDYWGNSDVGIIEDYVYVITEGETLIIELYTGEIVDTLNNIAANRIQIDGSRAYLLDDYGITILNIEDPLNPTIEGFYNEYNDLIHLYTVNDTAYYIRDKDPDDISWLHELVILDMRDASDPYILDEYNAPDVIRGIYVESNCAYISNSTSGLKIYDIGNPYEPIYINQIETSDKTYNVSIYDDHAYVAEYEAGMKIYNIANPYNISEVNHIDSIGAIRNILVDNNIVFVLSESAIYIYDVSDPSDLNILNIYQDFTEPKYICVENNYLYINDSYDSLAIIDITIPQSPQVRGIYQYQFLGHNFDVQGNYAYLAGRPNSMEVVDISEPTDPILVGISEDLGWGNSVKVNGGLAYLSTGSLRYFMSVLDITSPVEPLLLDSLRYDQSWNNIINKVELNDSLIFVPTRLYIEILRFTPTDIEQVAEIPTGFALSPNYPNPFNTSTSIRYELAKKSHITIEIYDILGRKAETLVNQYQPAGYHQVLWQPEDLSSGVYFYKLQAGDYIMTKKMVLLK